MSNAVAREPSSQRPSPRLVISYRRADSAAITHHIYDRLVARYGKQSVFLDIDDIPHAGDFRRHIRDALAQTDILVAVIGPQWLGARAEVPARIHDDDDPVRTEIELALDMHILIFPVLVEGGNMPHKRELPASFVGFTSLNAARVDTGTDFNHHVNRLIASMDAILEKTYRLPPDPAKTQPGVLPWLKRTVARAHLWIVLGTLATPLLGAAASLAPPWPPHVGIITAGIAALSLAIAGHRLRGAGPAPAKRYVVAGGAVLAVAGALYLALSSALTFEAPTTKERFAKGFVCTAEAELVYPGKCPSLGIDELRSAEYEAERLWTGRSVAIVKSGLVALWLATFIAMATAIAGLVASIDS